jgi:hypothetical protein
LTARQRIAALAAGVAAAAGIGFGIAQLTAPATCLPDPTAAIAATPAGGTWNGAGNCYTLADGIKVTHPETIENATFYDTATAPLPREQNSKPIVDIVKTSDVTISNLNLYGAKAKGQGGVAGMSKQSGVTITSSANVIVDRVTTQNQFSDGFELVGVTHSAIVNSTVVNSGRQGVTFDGASDVYVTGLNVEASAAPSALDWESDLAGIGAGNVTIANSTWQGTNNLIEYFAGPINFVNDAGVGPWVIGSLNSQAPITVTGGSYAIPGNVKANPGAISMNGGNLTFDHVSFTRQAAKKQTAPAYAVSNGGHLTLTASPIPGPAGFVDSTSTATVVP